MEPMTIGSAPSSPSSPGANPNFLPGFLMGDISQPNAPNYNVSPSRNRMPSDGFRKLGQTNTASFQKSFNSSVLDSPLTSKQSFTPHKPGPPSQGLFDTIEQRKKPTSPILTSPATHSNESRNMSRFDESLGCSRTFNEAVNRSRMDVIDTHWVTVFGFTPSALSLVLAQLSNCGTIVEKKVPSQGNWVHIKFDNVTDVPRALALNGRCINNSIMVGVSLYYPKENKENDSSIHHSNVIAPIRARPLGQSFMSPGNPNSVLPPQNLPQKSTGYMSKAIEYVFGW